MNLMSRIEKLETKRRKPNSFKVLYKLDNGLYSDKYQTKPEGCSSNLSPLPKPKTEDKLITSTDAARAIIASRHISEPEQEFYGEEDLLTLQNLGYQLILVEYVQKDFNNEISK